MNKTYGQRIYLQNQVKSLLYPIKLKGSDVAYITLSIFLLGVFSEKFIEQSYLKVTSYIERKTQPVMKLISPPFISPVPDNYIPTKVEPRPTIVLPEYKDERSKRLKKFLVSKDSPLAPYAGYIVEQADKYDIGWSKLVSIAGMESAYGKEIPAGSYNAWGLGGANFFYFTSWVESIEYTSKLLSGSYKMEEIKAIQAKYCPLSDNCNTKWSTIVHDISKNIVSMEDK